MILLTMSLGWMRMDKINGGSTLMRRMILVSLTRSYGSIPKRMRRSQRRSRWNCRKTRNSSPLRKRKIKIKVRVRVRTKSKNRHLRVLLLIQERPQEEAEIQQRRRRKLLKRRAQLKMKFHRPPSKLLLGMMAKIWRFWMDYLVLIMMTDLILISLYHHIQFSISLPETPSSLTSEVFNQGRSFVMIPLLSRQLFFGITVMQYKSNNT
mmetsp:Transcript_41657/g.50692  ORF Transcript_41657/g.50692 Transcript_41657/m.50692 type:complete len:208 (-) Transcript_41657:123-746(-)